jgi:LPXTG-site transpeptidase (sortase) family protein
MSPYVSRRRLLRLLVAAPLLAACGGEAASSPTRTYFEAPTYPPTSPPTVVAAPPTPVSPTSVPEVTAGLPPDPGRQASANLFPAEQASEPQPARRPAPTGLVIPRLELDARIVRIGTRPNRDGNLVWETAAFAVGHHQGSANPGEPGNVVLSGHISSVNEGAVFARLPQIQVGDGIVLRTPDRDHLYAVTSLQTVLPTDIHVLEPTDEQQAILITCVPDHIYTHRLIVSAAHV